MHYITETGCECGCAGVGDLCARRVDCPPVACSDVCLHAFAPTPTQCPSNDDAFMQRCNMRTTLLSAMQNDPRHDVLQLVTVLQNALAVVLESVVQSCIVAARARDDQAVEICVDGGGGEAECEPVAEVVDRIFAKEQEAVELRVLLHELDDGWGELVVARPIVLTAQTH